MNLLLLTLNLLPVINTRESSDSADRMASSVTLVGGNLVSDTDFRKRLAGRDAGVELQLVVEDLLPSWNPDTRPSVDNQSVMVEREDVPGSQPQPERDQLKITLKIFLHDCDVSSLFNGVQAALAKLNTNKVDNLFIATPVEVTPLVGIGSGAVAEGQTEATGQMMSLWRGAEQLIQEGKVGVVGLCDLHPPVFIKIYQDAMIKPSSIQVNLRSCCVVPEELSSFAKENRVTLLTHSDPVELLPGESLRAMLYPKMSREAGHYSAGWIARYQVHLKDRGVLLEKRYLIDLSK